MGAGNLLLQIALLMQRPGTDPDNLQRIHLYRDASDKQAQPHFTLEDFLTCNFDGHSVRGWK